MRTKKRKATNWTKLAKRTGLDADVIKTALKDIPSGRRRRAILATLNMTEGSLKTDRSGGACRLHASIIDKD